MKELFTQLSKFGFPKKLDTISLILFILLFGIGLSIRFYFLANHFTHTDDIGVAITIMNNSTLIGKLLSFTGWTYAPLQYLLEIPLLTLSNSYLGTIILGRLPSFLFGILNLYLCHILLTRLIGKKILVLIGDTLLLFSWENIIYCAQMEPYTIALTFIFIQLLLLVEWGKMNYSLKQLCVVTVVISVFSCYAQYQLFIFVFSFYVALFIYFLKDKKVKELKVIIGSGVITLILCVPLLFLIYRFNLLGRSLNSWNAGLNSEFVFNVDTYNGLLNVCFGFISFFINNIYLIFKYFFTTTNFYVSPILSIVLIIVALWGLIKINMFSSKPLSILTLYVDFVLILTIGMVVCGKLTLGPSRHNLVLFPILLLLVVYGFNYKSQIRILTRTICGVGVIIILLTLATFLLAAPKEISNRTNLLSQSLIDNYVVDYNPLAIFGIEQKRNDIYLLKQKGYQQRSEWLKYGLLQETNSFKEENKLLDNSDRNIIFISNKKIGEVDYLKILKYEEISTNKVLSDYLRNWNDMRLIYQDEAVTNCQVDYASDLFDNSSNGMCIYVLQPKSKRYE